MYKELQDEYCLRNDWSTAITQIVFFYIRDYFSIRVHIQKMSK